MPAQGTPQAGRLNNPKSKTPDDAAEEFRTAFSGRRELSGRRSVSIVPIMFVRMPVTVFRTRGR